MHRGPQGLGGEPGGHREESDAERGLDDDVRPHARRARLRGDHDPVPGHRPGQGPVGPLRLLAAHLPRLPPRPPVTAFDCQASPVDRQCQPLYLDRIRADRSSTRSGDGKGSVDVKVAVFEGGVAADVPDLDVPGGVDCLSGSPVVPGLSLEDHNGHGSLVAGIIGARDDGQGLVGVAPGTPLWSVRVADDAGVITATAIADYDGKPPHARGPGRVHGEQLPPPRPPCRRFGHQLRLPGGRRRPRPVRPHPPLRRLHPGAQPADPGERRPRLQRTPSGIRILRRPPPPHPRPPLRAAHRRRPLLSSY
ncbi:hypothetical protein DRB96_31370 [Streptomyces sp. ICC1]|nr:hypothetical protein DRB89_30465 [Streptomyces sp. ICC4]AWZ16008.1 hypothetical protein DRB96_31370 [Streptomyces sp. ICC1]